MKQSTPIAVKVKTYTKTHRYDLAIKNRACRKLLIV